VVALQSEDSSFDLSDSEEDGQSGEEDEEAARPLPLRYSFLEASEVTVRLQKRIFLRIFSSRTRARGFNSKSRVRVSHFAWGHEIDLTSIFSPARTSHD